MKAAETMVVERFLLERMVQHLASGSDRALVLETMWEYPPTQLMKVAECSLKDGYLEGRRGDERFAFHLCNVTEKGLARLKELRA